jgi:hypothetical protein
MVVDGMISMWVSPPLIHQAELGDGIELPISIGYDRLLWEAAQSFA